MKIRIVEDIDDPFLKAEWERLEGEADVFPQSTYHWCATWWKYLRGKRRLHVVMALDDNGKAMGIAPLCIERHVGIRVLRSFPANFGDFYSFIIPQEGQARVMDSIYDYVVKWDSFQAAYIGPVNDHSPLHGFLCSKGEARKSFSQNIVADIRAAGWEEYLDKLSHNRRRQTRKKMRLLEGDHNIRVELVTGKKEFMSWFSRIKCVQRKRWAVDDRPSRSADYMTCAEHAYAGLFDRGQMALYALTTGEDLIAYRIGLIHNKIFYDWSTNYDVGWAKYSPGLISIGYVIRDLIEKGFRNLDFMAGVYDYKLSWSPDHEVRRNDIFLLGNHSLPAYLFVQYHLHWRERFKAMYRKIKATAKRSSDSSAETSE